jgi:hypothetical protein
MNHFAVLRNVIKVACGKCKYPVIHRDGVCRLCGWRR